MNLHAGEALRTGGASFTIAPLRNDARLLDILAAWHHQECERQGLRSNLALRRSRLNLHLTDQDIPHTLVAFCGARPIGCVSLVNYTYKPQTGSAPESLDAQHLHPVWLSNLYVEPRYRNAGVASALIGAGIDYVEALGFAELWLSASEYTEFYRARGWSIARQTRLGSTRVNVMCRKLRPRDFL